MANNSLKGTTSATRNYWRWHSYQIWNTIGSSAIDPALSGGLTLKVVKPKPCHFDAGAVMCAGLIRIIRTFTEWGMRYYDLIFMGVTLIKRVRHDAVLDTWRRYYSRQRKANGEAAAKHTLPVHLLLPAPHVQLAGLLPAVCA